MGVDDSLSAVQLFVQWIERLVTEPFVFVIRPHAHTIGLQGIHRVSRFTKAAFDVWQRQRRKDSETAGVVRAQFRSILITVPRDLSYALDATKPDTRAGNRSQGSRGSALIHVFK